MNAVQSECMAVIFSFPRKLPQKWLYIDVDSSWILDIVSMSLFLADIEELRQYLQIACKYLLNAPQAKQTELCIVNKDPIVMFTLKLKYSTDVITQAYWWIMVYFVSVYFILCVH